MPNYYETKRNADNKKTAIGIMPDFRFKGDGVKVGAVSEGSSADSAGMLKGRYN